MEMCWLYTEKMEMGRLYTEKIKR
jgi:hypothetical protein